jgi:hypothetical protein
MNKKIKHTKKLFREGEAIVFYAKRYTSLS